MKHTLISILLVASLAICPGCILFKGATNIPAAKVETVAKWTYGGYNGSNSSSIGDSIANLKIAGNDMSYSWTIPESEAVKLLGSKDRTEINLYACLFVKTSSGDIVGGKFEWISVSRKTRQFENIFKKYGGWTLSNVPNPTTAYFCIINPKTGKRTNFIEGTWKR